MLYFCCIVRYAKLCLASVFKYGLYMNYSENYVVRSDFSVSLGTQKFFRSFFLKKISLYFKSETTFLLNYYVFFVPSCVFHDDTYIGGNDFFALFHEKVHAKLIRSFSFEFVW